MKLFPILFLLLVSPMRLQAQELSSACTVAAIGSDPAECDRAIARERDASAKATLLFHRAYAFNEAKDYFAALRDLDAAEKLNPTDAKVLHERAYTNNALGYYAAALRDSDREIALRPSEEAFRERALSRFNLGDFKGAYADRDRVVAERKEDADALLARGEASLWLGEFDKASIDTELAARLAKASGNLGASDAAERQREIIRLWQTRSDADPAAACTAASKENSLDGPTVIGDCSAAFLEATSGDRRAEYLTTRSLGWLVGRQNVVQATVDKKIAVAVDPNDARWHANLGFAYVEARHSWAALQEFDRAIAIERSWWALAGRARAKYNLNDKDGAKVDAASSEAIRSNVVALTVLGDIAFDEGGRDQAKDYWLHAWKLGPFDDLRARLKDIGVDDPEQASVR